MYHWAEQWSDIMVANGLERVSSIDVEPSSVREMPLTTGAIAKKLCEWLSGIFQRRSKIEEMMRKRPSEVLGQRRREFCEV